MLRRRRMRIFSFAPSQRKTKNHYLSALCGLKRPQGAGERQIIELSVLRASVVRYKVFISVISAGSVRGKKLSRQFGTG